MKKDEEREKIRDDQCNRVGCNVFGRLEAIAMYAEKGDDKAVRRELLALLKFYPGR